MSMTTQAVKFHPDAEEDIRGARRWYAEKSAIAARAFVAEMEASVEQVLRSPERWPRYLSGTRRYYFANFPFTLIYRVEAGQILVVAVAHHRRKPGYWKTRRHSSQP
jgi:plasmid stabilization system protein ParE